MSESDEPMKRGTINGADALRQPPLGHAQGFTCAGHAVQVSFWLADPPGHSHLLEKSDFAAEPAVVCSEKDIAILHIQFSSSSPNINAAHRRHQPGQHQHFVYKADHEHPSLDLLPVPSPICYGSDEFDLLPGADGEDGYRIAVLRQHRLAPLGTGDYEYDLHTFSSKTWTWNTRLAQLALRAMGASRLCHKANKVIVLDGSTLVDDESPVLPLRHIRLPPPMHINRGMSSCSSGIRDVICINGVIKFVEIANRRRMLLCESSNDLSHEGVLWEAALAGTEVPWVERVGHVPPGWLVAVAEAADFGFGKMMLAGARRRGAARGGGARRRGAAHGATLRREQAPREASEAELVVRGGGGGGGREEESERASRSRSDTARRTAMRQRTIGVGDWEE
uniref:Uncharacterized protein n=1 Tax=Setaria viridis TaxID=4556 RepID=A0A4U6TLI9_SETVI|nr:hypothetical protein SEVIR_9G547900v2 [Setaria viridis]